MNYILFPEGNGLNGKEEALFFKEQVKHSIRPSNDYSLLLFLLLLWSENLL